MMQNAIWRFVPGRRANTAGQPQLAEQQHFMSSLLELKRRGWSRRINVMAVKFACFFLVVMVQYRLKKVKVKEISLQACTSPQVSGVWGCQICRQLEHESSECISLSHHSPLLQDIFLVLISVRCWAKPKEIVQCEILCQWKIPSTL